MQKHNVAIPYDREIDMAMIEVEHLQKNFVKTVKEPGLKGLCVPLFILKSRPLKRSKI